MGEGGGGGYKVDFVLRKKYENKVKVGMGFDWEERGSVVINVRRNLGGKVGSRV